MTTYEDEIRVDVAPELRLTVAYELDPSANRSRVRTRVERREPSAESQTGSASTVDAEDGAADPTAEAAETTGEAADATDGAAESQATFELFRDAADEWRWRLRHRNGNVIADGGEGYSTKANARKGLRSVKQNAPGATVEEVDGGGDDD